MRKIEPKKGKFYRPNSFYSSPKNSSYLHKNWESERNKTFILGSSQNTNMLSQIEKVKKVKNENQVKPWL